MKLKTNDVVKIIKGKDKGKTGKILQMFPKLNRASVEGVNLLVKNIKPKKEGQKGQRISFPSPLAITNMRLICPKCSKPTRVGYKILENRKKARVCKLCKEVTD